MILCTIALFLQVSGVIGARFSLGIWLFGLYTLRRAQRVEQVRALAWLIIIASPLMVGSVVLSIARSGASIADIAAALCLTEGTVRNHFSLAMQKLGARNRMEAARPKLSHPPASCICKGLGYLNLKSVR